LIFNFWPKDGRDVADQGRVEVGIAMSPLLRR